MDILIWGKTGWETKTIPSRKVLALTSTKMDYPGEYCNDVKRGYLCTRAPNHKDKLHVAHTSWGEPRAVWYDDGFPVRYVIFSLEATIADPNLGPSFWSDEAGWVDLQSATIFSAEERIFGHLPVGDSMWVALPTKDEFILHMEV